MQLLLFYGKILLENFDLLPVYTGQKLKFPIHPCIQEMYMGHEIRFLIQKTTNSEISHFSKSRNIMKFHVCMKSLRNVMCIETFQQPILGKCEMTKCTDTFQQTSNLKFQVNMRNVKGCGLHIFTYIVLAERGVLDDPPNPPWLWPWCRHISATHVI